MGKNWIETHKVRKFQQGGAMPAEAAPAPAPEQAAPGANIDAMLAEYAQTRDPQLAVAICDMIVEAMAGAQAAPAEAGMGAPMARNGMKLRRGPVFNK